MNHRVNTAPTKASRRYNIHTRSLFSLFLSGGRPSHLHISVYIILALASQAAASSQLVKLAAEINNER